MVNPLISVVIPSFRSGPLIRDAIESVLAQTFQKFEIIIVDNNASEDTREAFHEMANLYPDKIRIIRESIQGVCSARNKGILEASGTFIALLDDDDYMYPERLEKQLLAMEQHPDVSLVYGMMNIISFDGKRIVEERKLDSTGYWSEVLFGDLPRYKSEPLVEPRPSVIFFRKDMGIKSGMFDVRFNPIMGEETEFYLRMWNLGSFYLIPEPIVAFRLPSPEFLIKKRIGNTNWFCAKKNLNLFFSILVEKHYKPDDTDIRKKFNKIRSQWLRELSLDILQYRDGRSEARALLSQAFRANATDLKNWKWYLRTFLPEYLVLRSLGIEGFSSGSFMEMATPETLNNFFCFSGDPSENVRSSGLFPF